jgi:hypothetical protein
MSEWCVPGLWGDGGAHAWDEKRNQLGKSDPIKTSPADIGTTSAGDEAGAAGVATTSPGWERTPGGVGTGAADGETCDGGIGTGVAGETGGGFWAVPGVEGVAAGGGAAAGSRPGAVGVGGFKPAGTALTQGAIALVDQMSEVSELVAVLHGAKARLAELVGGEGRPLGGEAQALDQIVGLLNVGNAIDSIVGSLLAEVDRSGLCGQVTGVSLSTWLVLKAHLTARQAARLVLRARRAGKLTVTRRAALAGAMNAEQVDAVAGVLDGLPKDLGSEHLAKAESLLVELAEQLASDGLTKASEEVFEQIAPEAAQDAAEEKAARQAGRANSRRYFTSYAHGDGVFTFSGSLPVAEGELVRSVIDAVAEKARRDLAAAPDGKILDRRQARADALVEICRHVQGCREAAPMGAAAARVVVTVPLAGLAGAEAVSGRLVGSGERLDARTLRAMACDGEITRLVLGAKSEVLDVGRTTRVIPKGIRAALNARDGGCSFPGCDRPVEVCQAHHIRPWNALGKTNVGNLVLVCPSHHRMVEPPKGRPPDWEARMRGDGLVEFVPPGWFDADRKPILHHRYRLRGAKPSPAADQSPPPNDG